MAQPGLPFVVDVVDLPSQEPFLDTGREGVYARVFLPPRLPQLAEVIVEDLVEVRGRDVLTGEAGLPDPVAHHHVVQRPVDAAEEGGPARLELHLTQTRACPVQPQVGEPVVGGQRPEVAHERARHPPPRDPGTGALTRPPGAFLPSRRGRPRLPRPSRGPGLPPPRASRGARPARPTET